MGKNIVLCGFMSCGKTTVGKKLATKMGYDFADTDKMITDYAGKTIREIFDEGGEQLFREIEYKMAGEIKKLNNTVVSTGGGMMTFSRNVDIIKNCVVVYLITDFDLCYKRLKNTGRPIVSSRTKQEMREMYNERIEKYKIASDFSVECQPSPNVTAEMIIAKLNLNK